MDRENVNQASHGMLCYRIEGNKQTTSNIIRGNREDLTDYRGSFTTAGETGLKRKLEALTLSAPSVG